MRRLLLIAVVMSSAAGAEETPAAMPLDSACRSILGAWQRETPMADHWGEYWDSLFVDATGATLVHYYVPYTEADKSQTYTFRYTLSCQRPGGGKLVVTMDDGKHADGSIPGQMEIEKLYTNGFITLDYEPAPHPPPQDWVPQKLLVKWHRIAP